MQTLLSEMETLYINQKTHLRTGQALFLVLPDWVGLVVAGTPWDPFHRELTKFQIVNWINDHLIFKDDEIVAVFNGEDILAERPESEFAT